MWLKDFIKIAKEKKSTTNLNLPKSGLNDDSDEEDDLPKNKKTRELLRKRVDSQQSGNIGLQNRLIGLDKNKTKNVKLVPLSLTPDLA